MRFFLALNLCLVLGACADHVRGEATNTVVEEDPGEYYYWEYFPDGHRVRRHRHRGDESRQGDAQNSPPPQGNSPAASVTVTPPAPAPAPVLRVKGALP